MAEDNNNDKLMEQFISKASPKLLEAMTKTVTELVEKQIGGLVESSTKMLDQIKDQKRTSEADALQLKNLLADAGNSGSDVVNQFKAGEPIEMSREQARDPAAYRLAKQQAATNGVQLHITDNPK